MPRNPVSKLALVEGAPAGSPTKDVYDDIQRVLQVPFVPDLFRSLAGSESVLQGTWDAHKGIYLGTTLPMSLKAMILYSISASRDCHYCEMVHHVTCRTLGVDESTLKVLIENLDGLTPLRVRMIVRFALKCAANPQSLQEDDYEGLRSQGITDEEVLEIVALAAYGVYLDIVADGMKVPVDEVFKSALQ